ncbi:O-antigen polymerase [Curtobacterium sp. Leaf261]|uniref:O-antigen polymerase n=1 Tax=Curtobacterium sp. Leaf261 TaxID=1736311 RepID=UPI000A90D035|nr:O-antigen polymerase [Curtobacterium sp. Leaf261]
MTKLPQFGLISALAVLVATVTMLVISIADSSPPSGQAALIGILGVTVGLVIVFIMQVRFPPLGSFAIYLYSHTAIFVMRPGYNSIWQDGRNIFDRSQTGEPMINAGLIGAFGFICVSLGYALNAPARRAERWKSTDSNVASSKHQFEWEPLHKKREHALVILCVLTFIAGVSLYLQYIQQIGGFRSFLSINAGRSAELTQALASSSGYLVSGLLLTLGTSLLLFTYGLAQKRRPYVVTGGLFLLIATLPQLMTGSRSVFVPLALSLLLIIMRTRPRLITWPRALLFGFPAFVLLFVAPRILRSEVTASNTFLDALRESFSVRAIMDGFFGGFDTAMIDAFALQIGAQSSGRIPFAGGSTYLAAILAFVPRNFWPAKPLAVDTILNQTLFPDTAAKHIGFSFGIYSEPYFNWGIIGVVLVAIIFGISLGKLDRWLTSTSSIIIFVAVALFAGQVFTLVRGSLSFDLQRVLVPLIPLCLIWFMAKVLTPGSGDAHLNRITRTDLQEELSS